MKRDALQHSGNLTSMACLVCIILGVLGCRVDNVTNNNPANIQTALYVRSTSPAPNATSITVNSLITVTFSEAINSATVTTSSFYLKDNANNPVSGTISCGSKSATFTPNSPLAIQTTYIATVTKAVKASSGAVSSGDYTWNFSTVGTGAASFFPPVTILTGSWPEAVAIGDVTGDGRNDVIMTTSYDFDPANDYKVFLFAQNASGGLNTALTFTASGHPTSVAIGDINGDGKNEVVIGNDRQNIEIFVQDGSGGLVSSAVFTTFNSSQVRIADLNHDGLLDVVGVGWGSSGDPATQVVEVFLQSGGTLSSSGTYSVPNCGYNDLDVGDVNNDGLVDIVAMNGQGLYPSCPSINVLTQNAGGTFNAVSSYIVGTDIQYITQGISIGDVTGDGRKDVVVTYGGNRPESNIGIFSQNTGGSLDPVAPYASYDIPEAVEVADINGDGKSDIVVLHRGWQAIGVYLQTSGGSLEAERLFTIPSSQSINPQAVAIGDINGDGLPDIAVTGDPWIGLIILYHN